MRCTEAEDAIVSLQTILENRKISTRDAVIESFGQHGYPNFVDAIAGRLTDDLSLGDRCLADGKKLIKAMLESLQATTLPGSLATVRACKIWW